MKSQSGFSLLEILIAVAILATAFVILLSGQGNSFVASERAEALTTASMLARQKMTDVEMGLEEDLAKNKFPDEKEESGEFDKPFDEYRWTLKIKKVEIPAVLPGGDASQNVLVQTYLKNVTDKISKSVREVGVTIFWGDHNLPEEKQPQMTVTTHIVNLK